MSRPKKTETEAARESLQAKAGAAAQPKAKVRLMRDGVTSEHGPHAKGDETETEFAAIFIERGWAEPV